jgi:hypothetical protein
MTSTETKMNSAITSIVQAYFDAIEPREGWEDFVGENADSEEWEYLKECLTKPYDEECLDYLQTIDIDEDTSSLTEKDWKEVWIGLWIAVSTRVQDRNK